MLDLTSPAYVRLATGTKVSAVSGVPTVEDMAIQLMREMRYTGGTTEPWPVGLHTFVVCDLLPHPYKIYGLLHDAPETVGGDTPRPVKSSEISALENKIHDRLLVTHGLHALSEEEERIIKNADNRALIGEVHTIAPPGIVEDYEDIPRDLEAERLVLKYLSEFHILEFMRRDGRAVEEFRRRYREYMDIYCCWRFEQMLRKAA